MGGGSRLWDQIEVCATFISISMFPLKEMETWKHTLGL